ncbi:phosphate ABC transporter permease PstA [Saccharibacillus kuerlensis]|uniref:Phosphate transport system permease protein PstA n=1 Tax=Saccharibacillus kuerlensis TaxID=459527 RepID=A0ABQ2L594_9BACL|nr:phosphate ABC transporter permease PstA [Saccharibacillus kuerlensis]GGO01411.1 phosphate transport system permease protein PstA [Saccharibacillus kuerlensis]
MNAKTADKIATGVIIFFAIVIVAILGGLLGFILVRGLSHISWDFLTSPSQNFKAGGGIGPQLFNSLFLLVLTMIITVPLGLGGGIYMAEYAKENKITGFIRLVVEVLSSFPSIVVGLFGLLLFVNTFKLGYSLLAGAIALAIFNLPLMVRITEQSFRAVPREQKEAGLALGLSKWKIITSILLPVALPSLITGTILAAGRVFGEAAALLFTSGMTTPPLDFTDWNPLNPRSPINPLRSAETLAVHIWKVNSEGRIPDAKDVSAGASAVLVIMVLIFNLIARWFGRFVYRKITASKQVN